MLSKYHLPENQKIPWGSRAVGTAVAGALRVPRLVRELGPGQAMPLLCTAERILAGGRSPQGNMRDVKGCC